MTETTAVPVVSLDEHPSLPKERSLPFLEKKVGLSGRNQAFTAIFITLAIILFVGGFVAAFLINQIYPAVIGSVVLVLVAIFSPLLDDSRKVMMKRAGEGANWANSRYGLQLTDDQALKLFYNPYDKHDRQPNFTRIGLSDRYGVTSTDRYQDGIQFIKHDVHGYQIVQLSDAPELNPAAPLFTDS